MRLTSMELGPRSAAFLLDEMGKITDDDARRPSEKQEASRIREKAETALTE